MQELGAIILMGATYFAISIGVDTIISMITGFSAGASTAFQTLSISIIFGILLNQIISIFLSLGVTQFGLKLLRGEEALISDLFSQGSKLIKASIAYLIYALMVALGFICLILPGIYLAIKFMFYKQAIVEKDLGIIEAFKYSSKLTRDNKLFLFALFTLSLIIILAGFIALIVGLIWAIPIVWLSNLIAYRYLHAGERGIQAKD